MAGVPQRRPREAQALPDSGGRRGAGGALRQLINLLFVHLLDVRQVEFELLRLLRLLAVHLPGTQ